MKQDFINHLITCPQRIIKGPSPWVGEKGHFKTNFGLEGINVAYNFLGFGRYNSRFNENFSFGLWYLPQQEKVRYELIRCNGRHGEHRIYPHHIHFHIHLASEESIEKGLKEDYNIKITEEYGDFQEVYRFFIAYINVIAEERNKFFPPEQLKLFN